jgi:hypothetical protein
MVSDDMCIETNIVTLFWLASLWLLTALLRLSGPVGVTVKVPAQR